jgi:hypothetical protein
MTTVYEIPLSPMPQRFAIGLPISNAPNSSASYVLTFIYRDSPIGMGGWVLDIADANGNPILCGVPLVTGADLLAQYGYLNLGGQLGVLSDAAPTDAVPTFTNLGVMSHVYWITEP